LKADSCDVSVDVTWREGRVAQ